ncbi:MAG: AAA family ATPase [Candidatus Falkowbacteria bacterium]|nr:AAA family ATPase [Candidatus Falkowbacteria bacterium]
MYLEKLEIQGFKSFANKNKLVFPGLITDTKRGITAIVGPNGSGKSNVADAVRWVLGEQSLKTLRGKRSEDVIFSGSDQKHQLSFAEASLHLNNEDKSFKFRIDPTSTAEGAEDDYINYPQIIITRRLYRNGDSEYLINNNRVRLLDIQMLLAKANFGQKTYSVIGQGMVENFLNTSAAERKDFFDEATGVKQFQIKRDHSLNKLESSYENLQQTDLLLNEIRPRLRSLTRQVEKLKKRGQLETELRTQQFNYYQVIWEEINHKLNQANDSALILEKTERSQTAKINKLLEDLNKIKNTDKRQETEALRLELDRLQTDKNQHLKQLARLQAEIELNLESQGQFDLSWLSQKQAELKINLEQINKELAATEDNIRQARDDSLETEQREISQKINGLNQELLAINQSLSPKSNSSSQKQQINKIVKELLEELDKIKKENDLAKIKELIDRLKQDYTKRIQDLETVDNSDKIKHWQKIQAAIIALSEQKQSLTEKINVKRLETLRHEEKSKLLLEKKDQLETDLSGLQNKIGKNQTRFSDKKMDQEQTTLNSKLEILNAKITEIENEFKVINLSREQEKKLMFDLQKNLQDLQAEHNKTQTELNNIKINATRQETRLEDLENNIRNEGLNLAIIKNHKPDDPDFDPEKSQKKINDLKSQLEQIGGIDPEAEKEYGETKERFDFLSTQTADLRNAINSLEKIIYELDTNIKERFDKEFKVIEEKFNEYFKILFSGGNAKIFRLSISDQEKEEAKNQDDTPKILEDEELKKIKMLKKHNATGLAGIEIQATPPGKKIQSVAMLSGGERALTAIALICAIISANPAPFVVLDEVDAALDESNSERLAKILDDLSNRTQFIVITHNRASMKKANILYGLTMHEGVSQLLSLKLEEDKK